MRQMKLADLDLFSSQFQLNVGNNQQKKRSCIGGFLSIVVITLALAYFIYLCFLYISNQIEPKYKSQVTISEDRNEVGFDDTFLGFNYQISNNKTLTELEKEKNKIYFVYLSYIVVQNQLQQDVIPIPIVQCTTQQLKGYYCFDLENIKQRAIEIDTKKNSKVNFILTVFRCPDTDMFKTTTPPNCASNKEIDDLVNSDTGGLHMKMFTSQYNTTSQEKQVSYKNVYMNLQGDNFVLTRLKTIKQTTSVKKGPFLQQETGFSSAIDYIKEERTFNREKLIQTTGQKLILQVTIDVAEQTQQIKIQYPTFFEVLAIFNSALSVLMGLGFIGRYFSRRIIYEDVSIILLQQLYQKDYLKLISLNNLFNQPETKKKKLDIMKKKKENIVVMSLPPIEKQDIQSQKNNDLSSIQETQMKKSDNQFKAKQEDIQTVKSELILKNTERNNKQQDLSTKKSDTLSIKFDISPKKSETVIQSRKSEHVIDSSNNFENSMSENSDKVVLPYSSVNNSLNLNALYEKGKKIFQNQQTTPVQSMTQFPQTILKKQQSMQHIQKQQQNNNNNNNFNSKPNFSLTTTEQILSNQTSPGMKPLPKNILLMRTRKNSSQTLIDSQQNNSCNINDYTSYQTNLPNNSQVQTQLTAQYIQETAQILNDTASQTNSFNNQNSIQIEQIQIKKQVVPINRPSRLSKAKVKKNINSSSAFEQYILNNLDQQQTAKNVNQICSDNITSIQNDKLAFKLQNSIFNNRFYKNQRKEFIAEIESTKLKEFMLEKTNNQLNVLQLFKDIILIKKAIMVILSNEQFAALQLTGCSLEQHQKEKIKHAYFKDSHLDEQMSIYQSQQKQISYIQDFLNRMKDQDNINEIDERILTSMTI